MLSIIVYSIQAIYFAIAILVLYRSSKVAKLRQEIIHDIFKFIDFDWRVDVFHSVSYGKMVFSVKPIKPESFYKDMSFLKPSTKPVLSFMQISHQEE